MSKQTHCEYLISKTYKEMCEYKKEKQLMIQIVTYNDQRVDNGRDILVDNVIYVELIGPS